MSGALEDLLAQGTRVTGHRPWPRARVDTDTWRATAELLAAGRLTLSGLWGETSGGGAGVVHLALLDEEHAQAAVKAAVLSLDCPDGRYPSLGVRHAPAIRLERAVRDLCGLVAEGAPDDRPWLDHGKWGVRAPLGSAAASTEPLPYRFLSAEGNGMHQIAVGPVHAGIIEPGHFRFTASGEAVVRLEERLGYVHKGIESLLEGADLARAARLVGHVSGDSTVAYAVAFARAVEAALEWEVPQRAAWLRALFGELERLANHIGDVGAICNDASFAIMHANCAILRERILRANHACFGHRLLMDRVVPGGVIADLAPEGRDALRALVSVVRLKFEELIDVYDNSPSMLERAFHTGILLPELARRFGCGGFVGRASRRAFDARKFMPHEPYDRLAFDVPVLQSGDVNARLWVRFNEVRASLDLVERVVAELPEGPIERPISGAPSAAAEGVALVEGFRGDVLAWVRIGADGRVARCHLRDPSWFQWPVLEAAIEGNIVADFPLCNKSFNCSYSGHDV
jgi:Ni,Fe-hydrogenase III large subunit/Ni,Fe-hydrogenase III component G